jgi:hypothetical protein
MKSIVFWVVMLYRSEKAQHFGGMHHLHLHCQKSKLGKKPAQGLPLSGHNSELLGLIKAGIFLTSRAAITSSVSKGTAL